MAQILDQYSYLHFASGVTAYFVGFRLKTWFIIHLGVDLLENSPPGIYLIKKYLYYFWRPREGSDPAWNIVADNVLALVGWISAYYLETWCHERGYGMNRAKRS